MNSFKARSWVVLLLICVSFLAACWAKAQSASDPNEGFQISYDSANQVYDLKWWGKAGRTYFLQESQDLHTWTWVPVIESGNNAVIEWGFSTTATSLFFRLRYSDIPTTDPEDADFDGDGVSNWNEIQAGSDPLNYYSQPGPSGPILITPSLTIVSGNNQLSTSGALTPQPLVVQVTNSSGGAVLVNAPVTFTATQGGGEVVAADSSDSGTSLMVQSASDGTATINFQQPTVDGTTSIITATTDEQTNEQIVTFTETSGLPAAVTGLTASSTNPDEIDLSWTLPTINDATSLVLEESTDGGTTWTIISTLGSDSTSYSDYNLDPTKFYEYQIVSTNGFGSSTSGTSKSEAPIPSTPSGLVGSIDNSANMNLFWAASSGATSYEIDRETLATGSWTELGTSSTTNYQDTSYATGGYRYRVSASADGIVFSGPSDNFPLPQYAVIDLGANFNPRSLNNSCDVVGDIFTSSSSGPVIWHQGAIIPLPGPAPSGNTLATDINDSDGIVGINLSGGYPNAAYYWTFNPTNSTGASPPTSLSLPVGYNQFENSASISLSNNGNFFGIFAHYYNSFSGYNPNYMGLSPYTWSTLTASPKLLHVPDPNADTILTYSTPGTGPTSTGTFDNRGGSFSNAEGSWSNLAVTSIANNRNGVATFTGVQYGIQIVTQGEATGPILTGPTTNYCQIDATGTITQLPFSWSPNALTDNSPYTYVNSQGHIYGNGQDQSMGTNFAFYGISSPSDPTQTQIVGNHSITKSGIILKQTNAATGGTPNWACLGLNDLLADGCSFSNFAVPYSGVFRQGPSSSYLPNSRDINNNGAIIGTALLTKNPDGTPAPINPATGTYFSHGVMLLPLQLDYITRNPDTGQYSKMGGIIAESEPTPEVSVNATGTQIDSSGNLVVNLTIQIRDPLSEITSSNPINSATIYVDEQLYQVINNLSSQAGGGTVPVWQPYQSTVTLTQTITIAQPQLGTTNIRVETAPNGAGNVGWGGVGVTLARHQAQNINVAPNRSITFTLPGTLSDQVVEQVSLQVDGQASSTLTESAANSNTFTGTVATSSGSCTASLFLAKGVTFSPTQVDTIQGILDLTDGSGNVTTISGQWTETGNNTLTFNPNTFYSSGEANQSDLYIASTTQLSQNDEGEFNPFVVRVAVPDYIATTLQAPNGWLQLKLFDQNVTLVKQDDLIPNDTPPSGSHYYYISSNNAPQLFAAVRQLTGTLIPQAAFDQESFKLQILKTSDSSIVMDGTDSVELQTDAVNTTQWQLRKSLSHEPLFASIDNAAVLRMFAESQIAQTTPAYTSDDVILWFKILFGAYGDQLWTAYSGIGGTIQLTPFSSTSPLKFYGYHVENWYPQDELDGKPIIIQIDSAKKTPIDAAKALFFAMHDCRSWMARSDFNQAVFDTAYQAAINGDPNSQNIYQAFHDADITPVGEALGDCVNAMEGGLSVASPTTGLAFTFSDVADDLHAGNYQHAGVTAGLAAVLSWGPLKFAKREGTGITCTLRDGTQIVIDKDVVAALETLSARPPRIQKMQALAPFIINGKVSKDTIETLYDAGWLKTDRDALKRNMAAAGMVQPPNTEVHHLLSLSPKDEGLELKFLQVGLDPSDPAFGMYLDTTLHRAISNPKPETIAWGSGGAWNYQWKQFFNNNPNATASDVRSFLQQLLAALNQGGPVDKMSWPYFP